MSLEITGKLHNIEAVENIAYTDKETGEPATFEKQAFVIAITENYNDKEFIQYCMFEAGSNACKEALNNTKAGDEVNVSFSLKGREYTHKTTKQPAYFNTLKAFSIKKLEVPDVVQKAEGAFNGVQQPTEQEIPF